MSDSPDAPTPDEELFDRLRAMWETRDPAPADLADRVLGALAPELADDLTDEVERFLLVAGGELPEHELGANLRAVDGAGTRSFHVQGLDLLVRVGRVGVALRRIDGWVAPGAHGTVVAHRGTRRWSAPVDGLGRFVLEEVPAGTVEIEVHLRPAGGAARRIRTDPFSI